MPGQRYEVIWLTFCGAEPGIGLKPQTIMEGKGGRGKSLEKRDIGGRYNDFRRILYSQLPTYIVFAPEI
jgi:hypothetical protein